MFAIDSWIECVHNEDFPNFLTVGRTYKVIAVSLKEKTVLICDNLGDILPFSFDHFKPVITQPPNCS